MIAALPSSHRVSDVRRHRAPAITGCSRAAPRAWRRRRVARPSSLACSRAGPGGRGAQAPRDRARAASSSQRDEFTAQARRARTAARRGRATRRATEIAEKIDEMQRHVNNLGKLLRRPVAGSSTPTADIFTALHGGLVFTGPLPHAVRGPDQQHRLQRPGSNGIDDDGVRFNGRFRLGFGAVLMADPDGTGEQITALTEFQSVGSFANNSFLAIPSASGRPRAGRSSTSSDRAVRGREPLPGLRRRSSV